MFNGYSCFYLSFHFLYLLPNGKFVFSSIIQKASRSRRSLFKSPPLLGLRTFFITKAVREVTSFICSSNLVLHFLIVQPTYRRF
ncbi:hypothetical protein GDO81_013619 [Engystomops pustulosus]|uniref:Uncharacterized protein n=1 Tax=Engystomops pustulosus TaxID=76066 RepID=A0AAV7B4N8_ENGPU|nr:hypothetical protein GDO81_013619 [Engystomops pustulosus]